MKKKGIILAGGLGTRLLPITTVVSKQLLPVYDKPMVYYPLSTLMLAGIRDVMIITTKEDSSRFKNLLGDGEQIGMNLCYGTQDNPAGIAHSFIVAEEFIGDDPVALILGDNIFHGKNLPSLLKSACKANTGAHVFAIEVDRPEKYGVVQKDSKGNVTKLLEKPQNPPTNLAVTGLYFYDHKVVEFAKKVELSHRGEYEITDINNMYLDRNELFVSVFDESVTWFDTGSFESLFDAAGFVKSEQESTGELIGCPERIAFSNGWISKQMLDQAIVRYRKSGYGSVQTVTL